MSETEAEAVYRDCSQVPNHRTKPPYPLHLSVKDKLHPEYVQFYNKNIIDQQVVHHQPISVSRASGTLLPGARPAVEVGSIRDLNIPAPKSQTEVQQGLANLEPELLRVRIFTPATVKPKRGWPVVLYFHGGGWVLGNIDTENGVCSRLCAGAGCLVVTVDYRLAPEHPFPTAVEDAWAALQWLTSPDALEELSVDFSRIAVAGSSAGGNLAAMLCQRVFDERQEDQRKSHENMVEGANAVGRPVYDGGTAINIDIKLQLLIVPVLDNTAMPGTNQTYKEFEFSPALPAEKMWWYRRLYLPVSRDWADPRASPGLWEGEWERLPEAFVVVGECDVLREEAERFALRMRKAGGKVSLKMREGMPHPFLAMDGVLAAGRETIKEMVEFLRGVFGTVGMDV